MTLAQTTELARRVADNLLSMGISLGACTLPAAGVPGFVLGENEIEVGLGIHGEAGVSRRPLASADALCELILEQMAVERPFAKGQPMALVVNGLGATPPMELAIICKSAIRQLQARGVSVTRAWCGTLLSALDMPGFSLSTLALDDDIIPLLDAPTNAPAWPGDGVVNPEPVAPRTQTAHPSVTTPAIPSVQGEQLRHAACRAAQALLAAEARLTELDALAGDGDLGASMKRGAEAILRLCEHDFATPAQGLAAIGSAMHRAIGGSSGPFYATALLRASRMLTGLPDPAVDDWTHAFSAAVQAISDLGGARAGDRTMLDALIPASQCLTALAAQHLPARQVLAQMATAAEAGALASKDMFPRMGRASYLGQRALGHPDGGAVAVAIWLRALAE